MMSQTMGPNGRENLGFREEVLSAFSFLVNEYGFRVVEDTSTFVKYESTNVFVNVYHGRSSYVLGFEIGQIRDLSNRNEVIYSLGDILDLLGKRQEERYTFFQASTNERVKEYVLKLALLVRKYGKGFLHGETRLFADLLEASWKKVKAYERETALARARKEAENAWRERDYAKLVEIYNPVREDLTPAELKKLEYAQNRSKK